MNPSKPRSWLWALFSVLLVAPLAAQGAAAEGDLSCRVCHPGAVRGLERSAHVALARDTARGCTACHGDLGAHAAAASRPGVAAAVAVAKVAPAACAECHPGQSLPPARGAHSLALAPAPTNRLRAADERVVAELARAEVQPSMAWSGLADFGYRLVHVAGSRAGYRTDVDLQPGLRARELELRGRGGEAAALDEVLVGAHDLGDPRWGIGGRAHEAGTGSIDLDFRRDRLRYEASGDWHRVDRSARAGTADLDVELAPGLRAFASFAHHDEEGFWLTERIGNRNVSVQSFVTGVASPRQARSEDAEVGVTGVGDVWTWTLAASYRDDHDVDRWSFERPAPANPSFPESEDFTSRSSLRGPGQRLQLRGAFDGAAIDVTVRHFDHDRRVVANGTAAGFDVAQFTTDTTALGGGSARTWLVDVATTVDVMADLAFVLDLHWRDHSEDLQLLQSDVTTFPTLSTTVTVDTIADQRTAQRLLDGAATLEWAACDALDLAAGYGFAEERLRVPDVDASDPRNFRRGTVRDRGVLANARWRPAEGWTVRGDWRSFGQDGVQLHELAPAEAREQSGSIAWAGADTRASVFVRHRRSENDVSQHRLDSLAVGGTVGFDRRGFGVDGGYTLARIDAATLTNFYFDPDPNPVPTFVGFDGDTGTIHGALRLAPSDDVTWNGSVAYTATTGDFDVRTLDWRLDLRWQVFDRSSSAGAEYRQSFYQADGGIDDWSAQSLFVYWRQRF